MHCLSQTLVECADSEGGEWRVVGQDWAAVLDPLNLAVI